MAKHTDNNTAVDADEAEKDIEQTSQERKGAQPATAPASQPEAAVSRPATATAPRTPRTIISNVRDPQIEFEDDPSKLFPNVPEERARDMLRKVHCHVIDTFSGRTKTKAGYASYKFIRHEVVVLPKWFAISHPTRLVIKE